MGHTSPQPNLPAGPSCSHVTDVETEAQEGPSAILMLKSGFFPPCLAAPNCLLMPSACVSPCWCCGPGLMPACAARGKERAWTSLDIEGQRGRGSPDTDG